MVTKGIVEEVITKYRVRVRIPILHKASNSPMATPFKELPIATVCCQPGMEPVFTGGDIVIVAIEDNDPGKPVIIGQLFREDNKSESSTDPFIDTLTVELNAVLPISTTIGNVDAESIQSLEGSRGNIGRRLDLIEDRLDKIERVISGE